MYKIILVILSTKDWHKMALLTFVYFLNLVFTNINAEMISITSENNHQNMTTSTTTSTFGTSAIVNECPDGWIYEGIACFYFNVDDSKVNLTWISAQGECEALEGHLAEPTTATEQEFLKSIVKILEVSDQRSNWWIGLSDTSHEGNWYWQYNETAVTFSSWLPGRPNPVSPNFDDCAILYTDDHSYNWRDVNCENPTISSPISFICQKANDGVTTTTKPSTVSSTSHSSTRKTTTQTPGCNEMDNWHEFENYCYKAFDHKASWYEANDTCLSHGANLVSIHSEEEDDFVKSLSKETYDWSFWIGLYWDYDEFKYVDESEFNYSDWDVSYDEPDEDGCVLISSSHGYEWWDYRCDYDAIFVCKKLNS